MSFMLNGKPICSQIVTVLERENTNKGNYFLPLKNFKLGWEVRLEAANHMICAGKILVMF